MLHINQTQKSDSRMPRSPKVTSTNFYNLQYLKTTCPMQYAMQKLGGRWKMIILWYIHLEVNRFSSLRQHIANISVNMLTRQLRELEQDGLITRTILSERPSHVEYSLTDAAGQLIPILEQVKQWGVDMQAREALAFPHDERSLLAGD